MLSVFYESAKTNKIGQKNTLFSARIHVDVIAGYFWGSFFVLLIGAMFLLALLTTFNAQSNPSNVFIENNIFSLQSFSLCRYIHCTQKSKWSTQTGYMGYTVKVSTIAMYANEIHSQKLNYASDLCVVIV